MADNEVSPADSTAEVVLRYRCRMCGYLAEKAWYGPCPIELGGCGRRCDVVFNRNTADGLKRVTLASIFDTPPEEHHPLGVDAFDHVLNGGIVFGSTVLIGGSRGSGKTTLLLQAADGFAKPSRQVLYASGEQNTMNIAHYAQRLGIKNPNVEVFGLDQGGVDADAILKKSEAIKAKLVIIDSAQSIVFGDVKASAGSSSQVDAVANHVTEYAKERRGQLAFIIVSHVNKADEFAGGTKLQHLVDTIVFIYDLEVRDDVGEVIEDTKGMRKVVIEGKNRHGPSDRTAFLELTETGQLKVPDRRKLMRWSKLVSPEEY
jgi:predicted ATP-dependent serine protease